MSEVFELVKRAREAQRFFEDFSQKQLDTIVRAMGKYVYDNAEKLSHLAVEETGIGTVEDKILKKRSKSRNIWYNLKDKKSRGIVGEDAEKGLTYIAKPVGVVGAVTPITNPIVTPMCNAMFALKCGNAIIFASHPKAKACAFLLEEEFMKIVKAHGGPDFLVQTVHGISIAATQELMQSVDVVVATGGAAMVKSAYSSGKPSYGVGAGNVPVIVDRGVDLGEAVKKIVLGAAFDCGIICSHEQFVFAPREQYAQVIEEFQKGKVWYSADEEVVEAFRKALFPDGVMNKDVVGRSAYEVGRIAAQNVGLDTRIILLKVKGAGKSDVLAREKLCPVVSILDYDTFENAVAMAKENLLEEGIGHSAGLHTNNEEHIKYAGLELPVSRLVINQPCSFAAGGALTNGFAPTTTLGCGTWGGNSIAENLDFKHLMNLSRIGRPILGNVPTDNEIWGE